MRKVFPLLQLGVLRLGLLQNEDVGVGVFPERKKILIRGVGFGSVAGHVRGRNTFLQSYLFLAQKIEVGVAAGASIDDGRKVPRKS